MRLACLAAACLVLTHAAAWAGPEAHTPAGGDVGKDYVLASLARILPPDWAIAESRDDTVPYLWTGASDAFEVKLEDRSIIQHHQAGFDFHPFVRLYFCPSSWVGTMEETDVYGTRQPAFLLGKNHIFRVFYHPRGLIRWQEVYDQLAVTFDLTRPRVDEDLRHDVDLTLRSRLARRMTTVMQDLRHDILDRVVGLDRQGNLLYVEYVANVASPPNQPGAPPLTDAIRRIVDEETLELAEQLFQAIPEATTIYMRRLCDNRMFDNLVDRDVLSAMNRPGNPPAATAQGLD